MSSTDTKAVEQARALMQLWHLAQKDHGGSRVALKLLCGLYNGNRFPFDLTELRCLDAAYLHDALTVIEMDARPAMEVHELLNRLLGVRTCGPQLEVLAYEWKLKGRCNREGYQGCLDRLRSAAAAGAVASSTSGVAP